MNNTKIKKRTKGRPKCFCRDEALTKAVSVFCAKGYQGVSIAQLTDAMGINPPSLYAEFGDKEGLFIDVLEHYYAPYEMAVTEIFDQAKDTEAAIKGLFELSRSSHMSDGATGCLVVNSGIIANEENAAIVDKIKALHERNEAMIYGRLQKGRDQGDIRQDVNIRSLARYINGILQGAAVLARGQQSPQAVKDLLAQGYEGFRLQAVAGQGR